MRLSALSENVLTRTLLHFYSHLFCQQTSAAVSFCHPSSLASGLASSPQLLRSPQHLRFSSRAKHELPSRPVHVAAPMQKALHWIPFMTCHYLPPRPARDPAQHRPNPVPRAAGTAPALSRPLALCASGSASSASPAFVGLTPSRANAIGVEGSPVSVIAQPVRTTSSPFRLPFICFDIPSPFLSCHRPV